MNDIAINIVLTTFLVGRERYFKWNPEKWSISYLQSQSSIKESKENTCLCIVNNVFVSYIFLPSVFIIQREKKGIKDFEKRGKYLQKNSLNWLKKTETKRAPI